MSQMLKLAEHDLTGLEKLGGYLFKWRDYTPIPLIILSLVYSNSSPRSLLLGLSISVLGEIFRTYSVAYIGTISRTRSYSNGDLIQSGPFSGLRNPLYLGNFLICLGIAVATHQAFILLVIVVLFYTQYIPIVRWEEKKLTNIFAEKYLAYKAKVPNRWFPSFHSIVSGEFWRAPDTWTPALKSEKRTVTALFAMYVALFLRSFYF